jgi:ArsR family transcriptional regulator
MIAGASKEGANVGDLALALGFSQPTVTHHLRILVDDGILVREQRGKYVWHTIAPDRRDSILDLLR